MPFLDRVLKAAIKAEASDLHVAPNEPFVIRRLGRLRKMKGDRLSPEQTQKVLLEVLTDGQKKRLAEDHQLDFAYEVKGLGRFRGSLMLHHRGLSGAFRIIPPEIPTLKQLKLPPVVTRVLDNHQGLILVTGATGQGKSTTLAAMIDHINSTRPHHILTVEDPVEFVHPLKKAAVNQRQLGRDTRSYANALKGALRQDPDVIMVGELRDLETISLAISAAETGHLVMGTLSTASAAKTIDRIIDSFPSSEQSQIKMMLAESLKAVVTQRLIPGADGKEMVLALEILIGTLPLANLIRDGRTFQIKSVIQTGKNLGMQAMDDCLMNLVEKGRITMEDAAMNAVNPERFKTANTGENSTGQSVASQGLKN